MHPHAWSNLLVFFFPFFLIGQTFSRASSMRLRMKPFPIRSFPSCQNPSCFKASPCCKIFKIFLMETSFILMWMKTAIYLKEFALALALKRRLKSASFSKRGQVRNLSDDPNKYEFHMYVNTIFKIIFIGSYVQIKLKRKLNRLWKP